MSNLSERNNKLKNEVHGLNGRVNTLAVKNSNLRSEQKSIARAASTINTRIKKRIGKTVAANVGSMPFESFPFYGVAAIVLATGYEVHEGCEGLKDVDELDALLGIEPESDDREKVCGLSIPTEKELEEGKPGSGLESQLSRRVPRRPPDRRFEPPV